MLSLRPYQSSTRQRFIEVAGQHARASELPIHGMTHGADQEPLGKNPRIGARSQPRRGFLDHLLFFSPEGQNLRQALVAQRWIGLEAHGIDRQSAGLWKSPEHLARNRASRRVGIYESPGSLIRIRLFRESHTPQ